MSWLSGTDFGPYSAILAESLGGVAEDLRSIDPVDLVSYIRLGSYATLEDLLQSATELYFKPGTMSFAWTAGVAMDWGELPTITLGMEFRHGSVSVFFDLSLRACDEWIGICAILFEDAAEPGETLLHLRDALAQARLPAGSRCGRTPAVRGRDDAAGS